MKEKVIPEARGRGWSAATCAAWRELLVAAVWLGACFYTLPPACHSESCTWLALYGPPRQLFQNAFSENLVS